MKVIDGAQESTVPSSIVVAYVVTPEVQRKHATVDRFIVFLDMKL